MCACWKLRGFDHGGAERAALQDSTEKWSQLASSFAADIEQQPSLLQGELRDYQMKVTNTLYGSHLLPCLPAHYHYPEAALVARLCHLSPICLTTKCTYNSFL